MGKWCFKGKNKKDLRCEGIRGGKKGGTHVLVHLTLSNWAKNLATYVQPLVAINWLTMTIPDKPTSPKQQYLTTLKGRLVLEFLKRHAK